MASGVQEVYTISEPTGNKIYLSGKIIPLHSSVSAYRTKTDEQKISCRVERHNFMPNTLLLKSCGFRNMEHLLR